MTAMHEAAFAIQPVRTDFVPKEAYISRDFLELEKKRLWTRVWQVACRVEEIPKVGDFVTYDVADQSIVVIRTSPDAIKAYHNVCMHRGRRLTAGCGHTTKFHCRYHGWQWNLDGSVARVLDRSDWDGCQDVSDDDFKLREVKVGTWGGFVYINMDPDCESLEKFLEPMPQFIDPFEFDKMRFRWYVSVKLPCNWKVALEAFDEGYHVYATHPQLLDNQGDDETRSFTFGKHGMFGYPTAKRPMGAPSPRTGKPIPDDLRPGIVRFFGVLDEQLKAIYTERDYHAATRLLREVPKDTPFPEMFAKLVQFQKEAAEAEGIEWPNLSIEQMIKAGTDWHVFPNQIFLMYADGFLCYRSRPNGDDPDSCIYDVWSLARYAPGTEPPLERQFFYGDDDWKNFNKVSIILQQDFDNMIEVQRGMKSIGFPGARTNPLQETSVSNMHRVLHQYLFGDKIPV